MKAGKAAGAEPKQRQAARAAPKRAEPASPSLVASIAVGALATIAFAGTVGYGFVWDDPVSVQRWLPALREWWSPFLPPANVPQFPPEYYRPLQLFSYRLDRVIGGGAAWPFHLTAVVLHVLATLLVLHTCTHLLGRRALGAEASLVAAAIFAVHPIHSESVAWMGARPDAMVTCLGLAALMVFWRTGWSMQRRSALAAALVFAALLCKENAAALLVLVPASLLVIEADGAAARRWPAVLAPFGIAAAAYLLLRLLGTHTAVQGLTLPHHPVDAVIVAIGTYLRLLVVPFPQNAYIADLPQGALPLVASALIVLAYAVLVWRTWRAGDRALLYSLTWIVVALAPSLAVIVRPPTAPLAERYLYLPSVGLCWALAIGFARLEGRGSGSLRAARSAMLILVLFGLALTLRRNSVWRDNFSLWTDTAAKTTNDGLPLRSLATATLERGDAGAAEALFQRALTLRNNPQGEALIHANLGTIAVGRGDDDAAERSYRAALERGPSADCYYNLGLIELRRAMSAGADAQTREAKARAAQSLFGQAISLNPSDAEYVVGVGYAAQTLGDRSHARQAFEDALKLGLPPQAAAGVRKLLAQLDEPQLHTDEHR